MQKKNLQNIVINPRILLILPIAVLCNCKESNPPSPEALPSAEVSSTESSDELDYPRLRDKFFEKDQAVEGQSSFSLGAHPKMSNFLDDRFGETLKHANPEHEALFGIEADASHSMMIQVAPKAADGSRAMIAIWKQREEGTTGRQVTVERRSAALEGKEEALAILKSFSSLDKQFESSVEWTVKEK